MGTLVVCQLRRSHHEQLEMCERLEAIADGLPASIDAALCRRTALAICPLMHRATQVERQFLQTLLGERSSAPSGGLRTMVERLLRESEEDLSYADELQETLWSFGSGSGTLSCDGLGYLLRSFFQSRQRRIALEQELLTGAALWARHGLADDP